LGCVWQKGVGRMYHARLREEQMVGGGRGSLVSRP
jgi:hypothetical protein